MRFPAIKVEDPAIRMALMTACWKAGYFVGHDRSAIEEVMPFIREHSITAAQYPYIVITHSLERGAGYRVTVREASDRIVTSALAVNSPAHFLAIAQRLKT